MIRRRSEAGGIEIGNKGGVKRGVKIENVEVREFQ